MVPQGPGHQPGADVKQSLVVRFCEFELHSHHVSSQQ